MCKKAATVTLAAAAVARQLYRAKHKHVGIPSMSSDYSAAGGCHTYPLYREQHDKNGATVTLAAAAIAGSCTWGLCLLVFTDTKTVYGLRNPN
jgi:hypothetical protein